MDSSFLNVTTDANIYLLYVTQINICFMHTTNNNLYKKLFVSAYCKQTLPKGYSYSKDPLYKDS